MRDLWAVRYTPQDGPDSVTIVEASSGEAARQKVLTAFREIDMDNVDEQDLRADSLGAPSECYYLTKLGRLEEMSGLMDDLK